MALKPFVDKLEDLDEPLRGLYAKKDGRFVLDLEGGLVDTTDLKTKLAEFRDNNRELNRLKADLEGKLKNYEGVDPEEYRTLKEKIKKVSGDSGDVEAVMARERQERRALEEKYEKRIAALEDEKKQDKIRLATESFRNTTKDAALKVGVDEKMLGYFIDAAQKVFRYEENEFVPYDDKGKKLYSKDSDELMSIDEWAASQITTAPGFFKQSSGGGAGGSRSSGALDRQGRRIISSDEFARNLEDIAKGKVVVGQ